MISEDYCLVTNIPENLQIFVVLELKIVERVLKNGITLDLGFLNLPKLKRGDFQILAKIVDARKSGCLQFHSGFFANPDIEKSHSVVQKVSSNSPAMEPQEISHALEHNRIDQMDSSDESSDEEPSPQSPARPFFCEICNIDYCENYHLPRYEKQ